LSGASVAFDPPSRRVGQVRCPVWALPSPGSLVLVQTAQVVTENRDPARTIHPQVDRRSVL